MAASVVIPRDDAWPTAPIKDVYDGAEQVLVGGFGHTSSIRPVNPFVTILLVYHNEKQVRLPDHDVHTISQACEAEKSCCWVLRDTAPTCVDVRTWTAVARVDGQRVVMGMRVVESCAHSIPVWRTGFQHEVPPAAASCTHVRSPEIWFEDILARCDDLLADKPAAPHAPPAASAVAAACVAGKRVKVECATVQGRRKRRRRCTPATTVVKESRKVTRMRRFSTRIQSPDVIAEGTPHASVWALCRGTWMRLAPPFQQLVLRAPDDALIDLPISADGTTTMQIGANRC